MKLKELFQTISFDNLLPYLIKYKNVLKLSVYRFREAYDRLRLLELDLSCNETALVEWWDKEDKELGVHFLDGSDWRYELGKEIVMAKDVNVSLQEVAALCLWEITFYGFFPEEREETFRKMNVCGMPKDKYEADLDKLEESIFRRQTPRKYREVTEDGMCVTVDFMLNSLCIKRMNRSKRKREYRQCKRIEHLKEMHRRSMIIKDLTLTGSGFSEENLFYLFSAQKVMRFNYFSVTGDIDYIYDSMAYYQRLDLLDFDKVVACLYLSSLFLLTGKELNDFTYKITFLLRCKDVSLEIAVNKGMQEKGMSLVLCLIK